MPREVVDAVEDSAASPAVPAGTYPNVNHQDLSLDVFGKWVFCFRGDFTFPFEANSLIHVSINSVAFLVGEPVTAGTLVQRIHRAAGPFTAGFTSLIPDCAVSFFAVWVVVWAVFEMGYWRVEHCVFGGVWSSVELAAYAAVVAFAVSEDFWWLVDVDISSFG